MVKRQKMIVSTPAGVNNSVSINLFDKKFKNNFEKGLDAADFPEDG